MAGSQLQLTTCPLCSSSQNEEFYETNLRIYFHCSHCDLVFLHPQFRLPIEAERAQYDLHQNNVEDPKYRKFLSRMLTPIVAKIPPPASVLDYGCGPGPALAAMFKEAGYQSNFYDPYYYPDPSLLTSRYQIITLTEVLEHCHSPMKVLLKLKSMLTDKGQIGIMTKRLTSLELFANWHYKNDPTHVCFYSELCLQWLASKLQMKLEICGCDSLILEK